MGAGSTHSDKETGMADVWLSGDKVLVGVTAKGANQIKAFCVMNEAGNNLQLDDIRLYAGYSSSGTLTSEVHDAGGWADWGEVSWDETLPPGTDITLQTKTSLDNVTWSDWSDNYTNADGESITSPSGRYIQYRTTLSTGDA